MQHRRHLRHGTPIAGARSWGARPARARTRMRTAPLLCVALLLLLASALAGCTARQSRDQYEERLTAAIEVRTAATVGIEKDQFHTAAQWREAVDRVNAALDELDADPPPKDAVEAHERFIEGMENLSGLLGRYGRCAALEQRTPDDARLCRQKIDQSAFDSVRNDFAEADTIYRQIGYGLPGMAGQEEAGGGGDDLGGSKGDGL